MGGERGSNILSLPFFYYILPFPCVNVVVSLFLSVGAKINMLLVRICLVCRILENFQIKTNFM